ncbi:MAG: DUF2723 domain-containing protein [Chloroflexi bacterium]|nr:MAG: DUF2723 domain-containing protein [Chloroflexota bacterium]
MLSWTAAAVSVVAFGIFLRTMLPSTGFWDTAEAQTVPHTLSIFHPTGFPTYAMLGWLWSQIPLGDVAWRMNVLSGICIALSAGLVVLITGHLIDERHPGLRATAAAIAGGVFAVAEETWAIAVRADVHALGRRVGRRQARGRLVAGGGPGLRDRAREPSAGRAHGVRDCSLAVRGRPGAVAPMEADPRMRQLPVDGAGDLPVHPDPRADASRAAPLLRAARHPRPHPLPDLCRAVPQPLRLQQRNRLDRRQVARRFGRAGQAVPGARVGARSSRGSHPGGSPPGRIRVPGPHRGGRHRLLDELQRR